jgi:hypothetical protein
MVEHRLGAAEAANIFRIRPGGVLDNVSPAKLPPLPAGELSQEPVHTAWKRVGSAVSNADRYTLIIRSLYLTGTGGK